MVALPEAVRVLRDRSVLVGALGYYVDSFDLLLFSAIRVPSLRGLGLAGEQVLGTGIQLLNCQMAGMLIGGLVWGVLGDRLGRRTVLFGSILLYSLANLGNALVTGVTAYAWLRFVSGFGLAGELGAAVTLVSERLSAEQRGYGTTLVAGFGVAGAMTAGLVAGLMPWRAAYVLGGVLGLLLLLLRVGTPESGLYRTLPETARRGDLALLARHWVRFLKCVVLGVPIWYTTAVLVTFMPELATHLECQGTIQGGRAIFIFFVGAVLGDLASGWASQAWRSRRRAILVWLTALNLLVAALLALRGLSANAIYAWILAMGVATGYWAVFITVAAEQFGTNLRSTVAVSVPNLVRGSTVLCTGAFQALSAPLGPVGSAALVGAVVSLLAYASLAALPESYGRDLEWIET